jgi:secondary thiamine-phosphate synthase enzyme
MFTVTTTNKNDDVNITQHVNNQITIDNGVCHITAKHTSCAITVNEGTDPAVLNDIHDRLDDLVPPRHNYDHDRVDGNADAHIKATLVGCTATLPVRDGELDLGTWQSVFLLEFDGGRQRTVQVTTIPQ